MRRTYSFAEGGTQLLEITKKFAASSVRGVVTGVREVDGPTVVLDANQSRLLCFVVVGHASSEHDAAPLAAVVEEVWLFLLLGENAVGVVATLDRSSNTHRPGVGAHTQQRAVPLRRHRGYARQGSCASTGGPKRTGERASRGVRQRVQSEVNVRASRRVLPAEGFLEAHSRFVFRFDHVGKVLLSRTRGVVLILFVVRVDELHAMVRNRDEPEKEEGEGGGGGPAMSCKEQCGVCVCRAV